MASVQLKYGLVALAAATFFYGGATASAASTLLLDTFTRGTPASPLNLSGSSPDISQVSGNTWNTGNSSPNATVTNGSQAIKQNAAGISGFAKGLLTFTPPTSDPIIFSADLSVGGVNNSPTNDTVLGIGFRASNAPDNNEVLSGPLNLALHGAGELDTFANGSGNVSFSGEPTTGANFAISYDPNTLAVSFLVNGAVIRTATLSSALNTDQVGFKIDSNPDFATLDNFQVTSTPEPATLGLVGAGVLLVGLRRRGR